MKKLLILILGLLTVGCLWSSELSISVQPTSQTNVHAYYFPTGKDLVGFQFPMNQGFTCYFEFSDPFNDRFAGDPADFISFIGNATTDTNRLVCFNINASGLWPNIHINSPYPNYDGPQINTPNISSILLSIGTTITNDTITVVITNAIDELGTYYNTNPSIFLYTNMVMGFTRSTNTSLSYISNYDNGSPVYISSYNSEKIYINQFYGTNALISTNFTTTTGSIYVNNYGNTNLWYRCAVSFSTDIISGCFEGNQYATLAISNSMNGIHYLWPSRCYSNGMILQAQILTNAPGFPFNSRYQRIGLRNIWIIDREFTSQSLSMICTQNKNSLDLTKEVVINCSGLTTNKYSYGYNLYSSSDLVNWKKIVGDSINGGFLSQNDDGITMGTSVNKLTPNCQIVLPFFNENVALFKLRNWSY